MVKWIMVILTHEVNEKHENYSLMKNMRTIVL